MSDPDFLRFMATLGVGGVLAGFMFYFYRKDTREQTELWRTQTDLLVKLIQSNIEANTGLKAAVEALHKRLDERDFMPRRAL